jgi:hypothetical protein
LTVVKFRLANDFWLDSCLRLSTGMLLFSHNNNNWNQSRKPTPKFSRK